MVNDCCSRDIWLIMAARVLRSIAGGALGVATGLYLYNVLHLPLTLIGVFFAVGAFTAPLMSLYLGILGDVHGRKRILLAAMAMLPVSVAILLLTKNYPLLLLAAALGNFGTAGALASGSVGAAVGPLMTAIIADKTSETNRTTMYSILNTVSGLGSAFGALLTHLSYIDIFKLSLVLSAVSVFILLPIKDEQADSGGGRSKIRSNSKGALNISEQDRRFIRIFALTGAFNGTAQGLVTPFLSIIFNVAYHMPKGEVGDLFFVGGLAASLITLATPAMTQSLGFVKSITITRGISTAALAIIPFGPYLGIGAAPAIAIYTIYVVFRIMALPAQSALMMTVVSSGARATTAGVNQAARLLPSASATVASGVMLDYLPLPVPFMAAVVFNIVNIFIYNRYFKYVEARAHLRTTIVE